MILYISLCFSTAVAIWFGGKMWWSLSRYRYRPNTASSVSDQLPSVSVCIAARNEMHALTQNLEAVLSSDYQKLEILVLDDNSNDETPLIIKSFAHAGVRFIAGRPLPLGWLGRNHAYQTLAHEASGDLVLYLDVDTLIGRKTISKLVAQLIAYDMHMLSVLPRRSDGLRASAMFGSLRYMWELVFASRMKPPSSSALWMIKRDEITALDDSLGSYSMSVRSELHIAKLLQKTKDYCYIIATPELQVSYEKRWHSQLETAERLYFPLFGRSVVLLLRTALVLLSLLLPIVVLLLAQPSSASTLMVWSLGILAINMATFAWFTATTYGISGIFLRIMLWPYLISQEMALYLFSLFRYATRTVTWKGRPVQSQPLNRSHYELNE